MPKNIPWKVKTTRATATIAISQVDFLNKFKEKFKNKQVYDFFVFGKTTVGHDIYFEIRSMRVNEFVYMLDDFSIRWKHITEKYK